MIFIVIFQDMAIILLTMKGKDDKLSLADIDFRTLPLSEKGMTSLCIKLKVMFFLLATKWYYI